MNRKKPVILIANGVNLDLLGTREPHIYGHETLKDLEHQITSESERICQMPGLDGCQLEFIQTNHEGQFLDALKPTYDGIIINPGAWTHTSLALGDRLKGLGIPYVEVHLSRVSSRESFRQISYISDGALGVISGFGFDSYHSALYVLLKKLRDSD